MAAALAATDRFWDCGSCRQKELDAGRYCHEDAPFPVYEIDDEPFTRCPVQYVTQDSRDAIMLYSFYKDGHLPNSGGLLDQDNILIEQLSIIASTVAKVEKERRDARK